MGRGWGLMESFERSQEGAYLTRTSENKGKGGGGGPNFRHFVRT